MAVLGGAAVSYERGTTVADAAGDAPSPFPTADESLYKATLQKQRLQGLSVERHGLGAASAGRRLRVPHNLRVHVAQ